MYIYIYIDHFEQVHCDRLVFPRTTSWSKDAGGWLNFKLGRAEHLATKNSDAQAGFASRFKRCQQVGGGRSTLRIINLTNGHVAPGIFVPLCLCFVGITSFVSIWLNSL